MRKSLEPTSNSSNRLNQLKTAWTELQMVKMGLNRWKKAEPNHQRVESTEPVQLYFFFICMPDFWKNKNSVATLLRERQHSEAEAAPFCSIFAASLPISSIYSLIFALLTPIKLQTLPHSLKTKNKWSITNYMTIKLN